MPYTETNWTDGVTKLGPTNLNKIENGVFSAALTYNVKDSAYGAKGDGSTDDTAAIQAAITACGTAGGGIVHLPAGTFKVSSTLTITNSSVRIEGAGGGSQPGAIQQPAWGPSTIIQWAGGASPVISWSAVQGCRASDFAIDGGATATHGLHLSAFQYGTLSRIGVRNCAADTGIACYMEGNSTQNTQWCSFEDLFFDGAQCLYLTGNRPTNTQDVTTCTFRNIYCAYSNTNAAAGVTLDFCDGNNFFMLYSFGKSGTGLALDIKDQARNNYMFGVFAGGNNAGNGTRARTPAFSGFSNTLLMTAAGNLDGSPDPIIDSGAILNYWTASDSTTEKFVTNALITAPKLSLRDQVAREVLGIKGETYPRYLVTGGTQPTGGTVYLTSVGLMAGDVITNLLTVVGAGGTGVNLSKLGLYSSSFNLLAKTADQGTSWNTQGCKTCALTAPYTVPTTGLYYIALIVNTATSLPFMDRVVPEGTMAGSFSGGSGNSWLFDTVGSHSDLPASLTVGTSSEPAYWFGWS